MDSAGGLRGLGAGLGALAILLMAGGAPAAVTISAAATKNMSCAAGVCMPTSNHAVLNAGALQAMLASGDVEVTTTGAGAQAKDIVVESALTWTSSHALTLDAFQAITVNNPVSITGRSALTLTTNDGGTGGELSFGADGAVTFADLASNLTINGAAYTLVGTVQGLASAVAANPSGDYALAHNYNAKPDGVYANAPVGVFSGSFEGLGNHISNLQVAVTQKFASAALFLGLPDNEGQIRDVGLRNVKLSSTVGSTDVGALAGGSGGDIEHCFATGTAHTRPNVSYIGGLVGVNAGTVRRSWAAVTVTGEDAGGLVGFNETGGTVSESFAQGAVNSRNAYSETGGLVGINQASIVDSYATSSVTGPYSTSGRAAGGGLVAVNGGTIATSYSTGAVSGFLYQGGLIGQDEAHAGSLSDTYWDTTTSGFPGPGQGAGTPPNDPGITGLTTAQLQSGLPAGFSRSIWGQNPQINGGLPYLLNNPPP